MDVREQSAGAGAGGARRARGETTWGVVQVPPPLPLPPGGRVIEAANGLRASAWMSFVGRVALIAVGLVVLAWIGRVATATTSRAHAAAEGLDAGHLVPDPPLAFASAAVAALPAIPTMTPAQTTPTPPPTTGHARATAEDPVYVNHAGTEELRRLPGVGPKRAEAIIALRQRVGRFQRVEDLLRVKGIGRATLRKWRALVRLDAPPAPAPSAADAGP